MNQPPLFLTAEDKIQGDDAVAAILVLDDGRYVMQLRDAISRIFYPDHWGCFGGAVNAGEAPLDALYRELNEELETRNSEAATLQERIARSVEGILGLFCVRCGGS